MARVALPRPEDTTDPAIDEIFAWVTEMEGSVPNHFFVELNFPEFFVAKLGATKVLCLLHRCILHYPQLWARHRRRRGSSVAQRGLRKYR